MNTHSTTIVSLIAVLSLLAAFSASADPIAQFDSTTFDFGKPMEGEKVKIVFNLKNAGDSELEITKVHAGCGCTEAKATQNRILPGESAAVEAVFNTSGYRNEVSKTITVTTNDPAHQSVVLTIRGNVTPIAELKPQSYINLGDMKPGDEIISEIILMPKIEKRFKILRVDSSAKIASAVYFDKRKNREGNYVLKIKVVAHSVAGRFYDQLSVVTDLPGNPVIRFPVYGNVVNDAVNAGGPPQP